MAVTHERLEDPSTGFLPGEPHPTAGSVRTPERIGASAGTRSARVDPGGDIRRAWSRGLLVLWTLILVSTLFEPAPNPNAVVPLWASVLGFAFLTGFFTTAWGLASNQPWGIKASMATATLGLAMAAACAVTDHHPAFW
ncbi:MAG: hypothetical protein M3P18_16245, partial [Actinomycetota bacterium]|nr:hypothetical protein [Actinomycetota bacterium]